ncbi:MAG: 3-methyl-2-oxobutanoate hydroxymethyltransferase [Thermoanaerobaculia bacterium]|nr:3-methyl-2-oxobutanoate hydroxymethyltransferase [Thermoanaerobaculia bacterium]
MSAPPETPKSRKVTVRTLARMRRGGEPIAMVTAYDYPGARLAERAGIDVVLVGDSLAMVVLGHENTLAVTLDEMLHHARAVRRGASTPLLVGDLPFLSYQAEVAEAVRSAGRFLQEAGMDAVKLEGGRRMAAQVEAIAGAGIPVMGHLGLTPQSVHALGGWRVQARSAGTARDLLDDALALERAGCFALVLESVPARLAELVTRRLSIPTIGIGAGAGTSGQVLVLHDLLGLFDRFTPKFARRYAELGREAVTALAAFRDDVRAGRFPTAEHAYEMSDESWAALAELLTEEGGAGTPATGPRRLAGRR